MKTFLLSTAAALLLGCNATSGTSPAPEPHSSGAATAPTAAGATARAAAAAVDQPAPDFTLKDYDGKPVHLADYRGKIVVLEWFNPDCPFVKAAHTKGSLKGMAKRWTDKGVVWLAIDSAAPGKQGNTPESVAAGKKAFGMEHPILADESGQVGHQYGATNTPHLFVIDARGVLVYHGAIDNSADGEGESPTGGKLVNHVEEALGEVSAGKPVTTKETRAYGCSVKYGS